MNREKSSDVMNYREWLKTVPVEITGDSLWTIEAYRLAMFAVDVGWTDVTKLMQDKRTIPDQRASELREDEGSYQSNYEVSKDVHPSSLDELTETVPFT